MHHISYNYAYIHSAVWSTHKELGLNKYFAENILCIALVVTVMMRSLLTVFPNQNPLPFDNQRCLDILVLVMCVFLPTQCFLSAAGVSCFLKPRMIMNAVFRSACPHFRKRVRDIVALRVNTQAVVVFLLILLSLAYYTCIVYEQWDYRLQLYSRVLGLMIPAFALIVQSFGQGCVLLFTSLCPVASKSLHKLNQRIFIKEIHFHMVLNLALLVNPITTVLTDFAKEHGTWIFLGLATAELVYRLYSVFRFHKIAMDNAAMDNAAMKHVHTTDLLLVRDREYSISQLFSIRQRKKPAKTTTGDAVVSAQFCVPLDQFRRTRMEWPKSGNECKKEHKLLCQVTEYDLEQYSNLVECYQRSKKLKMD